MPVVLVRNLKGPMQPVADAPDRPAIYLDQWVWVRLAKADLGDPGEPSDAAVLAAVREAFARGVLFPLSTPHYIRRARLPTRGSAAIWRGRGRLSPGAARFAHAGSCCATRWCTRCT
jgi:hypothetical protein